MRLYNGLNFTIYDSLNWAFAVDAFVCTVGSGLVLVNWLAARPGVAHAERAHMDQMEWWGDIRPDAPMPLVPKLSDITDVGAGSYCDYDLDWRIVLKLLRETLDNAPSRPATGRHTLQVG